MDVLELPDHLVVLEERVLLVPLVLMAEQGPQDELVQLEAQVIDKDMWKTYTFK